MKINNRKSFVTGIKGKTLSNTEKFFLKKYKPWGVILFSRNIHSIKQTQNLTQQIKKIFKDNNYPILIDEEGGKVSRLSKFLDSSTFSAEFFGKLLKENPNKFHIFYDVYIKQICYILKILGINLNTVPVLDIRRKNANSVIGNRAYSSNKLIVSKMGNICINSFFNNKIGTMMKHIPGHGLSKVDSHKKKPIIKKSIKYLKNFDFFPFKNKKCLFAMTAHIVYQKIDPDNAATHSKKVIKLIRNNIGFKNLIISDDISMKALKNSISINTKKAFIAGCNLVLHCNGKLSEMKEVARNSPTVSKFIIKKTSQFNDIIS